MANHSESAAPEFPRIFVARIQHLVGEGKIVMDNKGFPPRHAAFTDQLRVKSRRRRDSLKRLAKTGLATRAPRNDILPQLEIVYIPLDELRSPNRNVRRIDPAHVREVAATISALGFCVPVLIGKNNVRIDAEVRLEAAKLMGLKRVPCAHRPFVGPRAAATPARRQ